MVPAPPPAIAVLIAEHDLCRSRLDAAVAALTAGVHGRLPAAEDGLTQAWSLLRFLEYELETHIAKEEGPLFPRLKAALPASDRLIDEMVAEHDLIRIKRSDVRELLAEILGDHDDLRVDRASLRAALAQAPGSGAPLRRVEQAVDTVAAKLRVHFENEEELVFPLAPDLLNQDELDQVAAEMAAVGTQATTEP
jgi:iron-sulfur cluster repair protein YtfE (RIC family)